MSEERKDVQRHEVKVGGYDWPDYIVTSWLINECVVGISAVEVIGEDDAGPAMLIKGWQSSPADSTNDPDKAETIVEGSIKWDGCSDLHLGRAGYVHSCSRRGAAKIGELISRLYTIAKERMVAAGSYVEIDD